MKNCTPPRPLQIDFSSCAASCRYDLYPSAVPGVAGEGEGGGKGLRKETRSHRWEGGMQLVPAATATLQAEPCSSLSLQTTAREWLALQGRERFSGGTAQHEAESRYACGSGGPPERKVRRYDLFQDSRSSSAPSTHAAEAALISICAGGS